MKFGFQTSIQNLFEIQVNAWYSYPGWPGSTNLCLLGFCTHIWSLRTSTEYQLCAKNHQNSKTDTYENSYQKQFKIGIQIRYQTVCLDKSDLAEPYSIFGLHREFSKNKKSNFSKKKFDFFHFAAILNFADVSIHFADKNRISRKFFCFSRILQNFADVFEFCGDFLRISRIFFEFCGDFFMNFADVFRISRKFRVQNNLI